MVRKRKNEKRKTESRSNRYFVIYLWLWNGKHCVARTVAEQSIEMELWQSNRSDRYKTVVKSGKFE